MHWLAFVEDDIMMVNGSRSMKKYKKHHLKLTLFGKIFFSFLMIALVAPFTILINTKNQFYEKEENEKYTIEIEYPKLKNENVVKLTKEYIDEKKQEFINEIEGLDNSENFQYDFKTSYEINEDDSQVGVHLTIFEYTGGAHYIREDKSYYYDKADAQLIDITDFLEEEDSLDKLSNLAYYYVMQYSRDNNLGFDSEMVKLGLGNDPINFEHFKFTDKGLELLFPPYQVASYAAGEVNITVPYDELVGVIKKEYLKNISINDMENQITKRNLKEFSNKKLIAFTFDDGPSFNTNKLLDNLDKYDARVTFFVLGSRVNQYSKTLKKAHEMGNLIASHTYNHKNLFKLDKFQITSEIRDTNDAIKKVIGRDTFYLRPPYGNINSDIKKLANMYTILWDLDTEDWKYKDKMRISNYIVENAHDGAIVLLHDLYETSVDGALDAMERLKKQGYAFVTIEEMALIKNIDLDREKSYHSFSN